MLDLKRLIVQMRPDLRATFEFEKSRYAELYLSWLITSGVREYKALSEDVDFVKFISSSRKSRMGLLTQLQWLILAGRPDVQKALPLPAKQHEFLEWFYTHGLEEHGYWRFLSPDEKQLVLSLPEPWPTRLERVIARHTEVLVPVIPFKKRPFGVNLVGYAFGQLGIGEDARMAGRALISADVPMTMLDFPPGDDVGQNDRSMVKHVSDRGDFAFNIFCLTAEETGRYYAERGRQQFVERYNIGYWPWELSAWPKEWRMMLDLVDEVWVSSQHTYDAVATICTKPLRLMPMAVELGRVRRLTSRNKARAKFGLPAKARLFCFSFDLKSSVDRKNPQACVDAFLVAFPKTEFDADEVGLVIKAHKPSRPNLLWTQLKKLASRDTRIHIIEQTLDRPDLLALYQACDCFVSLHRAEGFGRGLAEALQLGLHVICTGYSGNVDFCQPPHADLVRYRLVKVGKDQYPHSQGQVWAKPDIKHAAELMRQFVQTPVRNLQNIDFPGFSPEVVGKRYKKRLKEIYTQRAKAGLAFESNAKR